MISLSISKVRPTVLIFNTTFGAKSKQPSSLLQFSFSKVNCRMNFDLQHSLSSVSSLSRLFHFELGFCYFR